MDQVQVRRRRASDSSTLVAMMAEAAEHSNTWRTLWRGAWAGTRSATPGQEAAAVADARPWTADDEATAAKACRLRDLRENSANRGVVMSSQDRALGAFQWLPVVFTCFALLPSSSSSSMGSWESEDEEDWRRAMLGKDWQREDNISPFQVHRRLGCVNEEEGSERFIAWNRVVILKEFQYNKYTYTCITHY